MRVPIIASTQVNSRRHRYFTVRHDRLAVAAAFAALRLLPMTDHAKDATLAAYSVAADQHERVSAMRQVAPESTGVRSRDQLTRDS